MPADPSSLIPSGLTVLGYADRLRPAEEPHLLAYLATVSDPRRRAGRRHPLVAILGLAAAAVLGGARSIVAIAEWAADAPQPVRAALGARRAADGRRVHLLAAMDHATRTVLAQRQADGAPGEVPAFQPLLAGLDLAGVVVTADALQTHPAAAEFLVACKQAHYLFTVKANQPTLLDRCAGLAWHRIPVLDRTCDRGHGRVERRALNAVTVHHFGFPHAAQVIQVTRKVGDLRTQRWRTVTVYVITSLTFEQASPARLADYIRGRWAIENGLHYLRDVTFAEDGSQVRTGTGPHVMACLRNLAIGVLSRAGPVNLAAALRHHARDPARPLTSLGITLG